MNNRKSGKNEDKINRCWKIERKISKRRNLRVPKKRLSTMIPVEIIELPDEKKSQTEHLQRKWNS